MSRHRIVSLVVVTLLLAFSAYLVHAQPSEPREQSLANAYKNSWAVVIGIDSYKRFRRLNYAAADAKAVAALLPSLGFPKGNVEVLVDGAATKARIESAFYRGLRNMGPNDRLLVYFAGHGETLSTRTGEEGYILPVDADPDNLPLTAIAMDDVQRIAKRLPAKHYLFVMDACFSGFAAARGGKPSGASDYYASAALREPVVQVITAGRKGQESIEEAGHGLFTRRLLDGLRGLADTEGQGFIAAGQLAAWIETRVVHDSKGRMTPQYGKLEGEGHFLFFLPKASAALPAVDLTGTFTGTAQGQIGTRAYAVPISGTLVQNGKHLSGTWTTHASSGTLAGLIDGAQLRAFRVDQASPCPATFHGNATVQPDNNGFRGFYSGDDCSSKQYVSASFHLSRIDKVERLDAKPLEPADLVNIGLSYLSQQRFDDAIDYFEQALRQAERRGDELLEANVLAVIGNARLAQRQPKEAVAALTQSLSLLEKIGAEQLQGFVLLHLGRAHAAQGATVSARIYLARAVANFEKFGSEPNAARALWNLGVVALQEKRPTDAMALLDRATALAERHSLPEASQIRRDRDQAAGQVQR